MKLSTEKTLITLMVFLLSFSINAWSQTSTPQGIPLKSGTLVLEKGDINITETRYYVVQFEKNLSRAVRDTLHSSGVHMLSFLYRNAWLCAIDTINFDKSTVDKLRISAITPWEPEYKISPELMSGKYSDWAITDEGLVKLIVTFFDDVTADQAESFLTDHISDYELFSEPNVWAVEVLPENIDTLINRSIVKSVEEGPIPFQPLNDGSRSLIDADTAQNPDLTQSPPVYNGLSGSGVNVAVSESVYTLHPDFRDHSLNLPRFLNHHTGSGSAHGTHVAGTIGGNGWNSDKDNNVGSPFQWRGIAPEASLISGGGYGTAHRVDASNHSYVMNYGYYGYSSASADKNIRGGNGLPNRKPRIWAAANQGITSRYNDEEGYYSIYAPAKNPVVIGALNVDDSSLASFSSLGPTFDGRIKPDVMAGGCRDFFPPEFSASDQLTVHIDYIRILDSNNNPVRSWEFNTDGDLEDWFSVEKHQIYNERVASGLLSFETVPLGYGFVENLGLTADVGHVIEIRYRVENTTAPAFEFGSRWYWPVSGSGDYVDGVLNYTITIDDQFHVATIPVGQHGWEVSSGDFIPVGPNGWQGTIDRLRIDPLLNGGIVSTSQIDGLYIENCGTSMAAPAVTGTVALMLQQLVQTHGINLATNPPLPSTIKGILIHTAEDLVHTAADPRDPDNPDTLSPVFYHKGPDFATGYGRVNAPAAVELIEQAATSDIIEEGELDVSERAIYQIDVATSLPELKLTLVWDDMEASTALGDQRLSRLVNDLDLVLIDPMGKRHQPWRLDALPVSDCGGSGPGCGDLDPIRATDVRPAYKGPDSRNNVEQVQVASPAVGKWKVIVQGYGIQVGPQTFSLVSSLPVVEEEYNPFVLTANLSHSIDVRLINPDGSFDTPFVIGDDLGVNYGEFAVADFTGDGLLDFIAATNEDPARLYLFTRTGTTSFVQSFLVNMDSDPKAAFFLANSQPLLAPDYGLGLLAVDIDNDGDADFVENINHDFGANKYWMAKGNVYLNDGSAGFTKVTAAFDFTSIYSGWTLGMSNTLVDINGDGYADMLASEQSSGGTVSSQVYLLKGMAGGGFQAPIPVFTTNFNPATYMTLGDFNNDGNADAIVGQDDDGDPGAAFLFLGNGDGTFQQPGLEAFDVRPDIETGNDQPGGGMFQVYDVDGDEVLDVISAHKLTPVNNPDLSAELVYLKGNGDGSFASPQIVDSSIIVNTAFQAPVTLAAEVAVKGDLNGDRCVDRLGDMNMVLTHIRKVRDPLLRDQAFDLNGDGQVNILDVRTIVTLFSRPRGANCP